MHHINDLEDKIRELDDQEEKAIKQGMRADFLLEYADDQDN